MFSEEQSKLRLEGESREKGTQIYRTVVPTHKGYIETEAAPSEEKGLLSSAKDAIASAVTSGIESVKELIHDVGAALEPEEANKERQNPESPLIKVPTKKNVPYVSSITKIKIKHREPKRHDEKKSWTQKLKETVMGTLTTEEETPLK